MFLVFCRFTVQLQLNEVIVYPIIKKNLHNTNQSVVHRQCFVWYTTTPAGATAAEPAAGLRPPKVRFERLKKTQSVSGQGNGRKKLLQERGALWSKYDEDRSVVVVTELSTNVHTDGRTDGRTHGRTPMILYLSNAVHYSGQTYISVVIMSHVLLHLCSLTFFSLCSWSQIRFNSLLDYFSFVDCFFFAVI